MGNYSVAFIRDDEHYSSVVRELGDSICNARVVPFVGAGISRAEPSRLATSPILSEPLREAMRESVRLISALPATWGSAEEHLRRAPPERLLDMLQRTHGEAAIGYLSVLNGDVWNANHSRLASFAAAGLMPLVVTLNFDLLIEKAVASYGCSSLTSCPLLDRGFTYGEGQHVITILKPHGSFSPDASAPFGLLSATLSQVGSEPSRLNAEALNNALESGRALLVAGYSDNDWDIFPILAATASRAANRVVWVQHARRNTDGVGYEPGWGDDAAFQDRVVRWLREDVASATLLVGDVRELLEDVAEYVDGASPTGIGFLPPKSDDQVPEPPYPDNSAFRPNDSTTADRTLRTLISLAMLIKSTGEFSERLLEHLRDECLDMCPLDLAWQLEETLSNFEHDRGAMRRSIAHMRRAIAIKRLMRRTKPDGHNYVWLGYKYLCRVKRPEPSEGRLRWAARFPLNLLAGLRFLWRGASMPPTLKAEHGLNVAPASVMARYYVVDLLQTWATAFVLWRDAPVAVRRLPFKIVAYLYEGLAKKTDLLEREYYYLRRLEARLFSGRALHDLERVLGRLDDLEKSYRLTQNDVQLGNAFAYRALVAILVSGDQETARQQLDEAERLWTKGGRQMASGKRRVRLFRRLLSSTGRAPLRTPRDGPTAS